MKILMFGWEFPPHISGGLGTACYGMAKGLLKNGIELLFVVPKAHGDEDPQSMSLINASDVEVDTLDTEFRKYVKKLTYIEVSSGLTPYLSPEEYENLYSMDVEGRETISKRVFSRKYDFSGTYGKNLMEEVSRYAVVGGAIATKYDFDIIHAHDWLTYGAGVAAKEATGKPLVAHMHATEFDRSGKNINTDVFNIEKRGMGAADRVIAVSNFTRQIVINKHGIDPNKVVTVHNAIEPGTTGGKEDVEKKVKEKIVTFLGRVTFQKGPEYFIEAAHKILQKDQNVRFVMAGSGDMLNKMIRRAAQLRISHRFHFAGFLKGTDVEKMFSMSDVFVMPSVSEPFGLVPLEAMRTNVPVVISKQSGVSEVLRHALKVDFWDVDGLADSIYALLHYKSLSEMFARYGKAEVDNLKWEFAGKKIVEVYKDVIHLVRS